MKAPGRRVSLAGTVSQIEVVTRAVAAEAQRLRSVRRDLDGANGWMAGTADAAADTPAAGACQAMVERWSGAIVSFGQASDGLSAAVAAAAECYAQADALSMPVIGSP